MSYPLIKILIVLILVSLQSNRLEFIDRVEEGSNNIYSKTFRGFGNFIIAGNNVARVIRQLGDHFKPAPGLGKTVPTGPIELGTLGGRLVIQDPLLRAATIGGNSVLGINRYIVGYRGDNYLFAGLVYAPYGKMRHCQVTDNENLVNCGKVRSISKYSLRRAA